jgi:tripartite-type tricarboxylate transporter receptor subunit TctC
LGPERLSLQVHPLHRARWPPGGGSDFVGRTVTERWGQALKQTFVVDNQSGGGGTIACQATAAPPPTATR